MDLGCSKFTYWTDPEFVLIHCGWWTSHWCRVCMWTKKQREVETFSCVCSLCGSILTFLALVILVYCLEASSEKLAFGDRYAHKLHNKVTSVDELRMLSDKHCMYSVYKKFNEFQLGSLKQTMQEYLQEIKEIVSW